VAADPGSAGDKPELFDFLTDRGEDRNLAAGHEAEVSGLKAAYETWWADVAPGRRTIRRSSSIRSGKLN